MARAGGDAGVRSETFNIRAGTVPEGRRPEGERGCCPRTIPSPGESFVPAMDTPSPLTYMGTFLSGISRYKITSYAVGHYTFSHNEIKVEVKIKEKG